MTTGRDNVFLPQQPSRHQAPVGNKPDREWGGGIRMGQGCRTRNPPRDVGPTDSRPFLPENRLFRKDG
jgi:hypothetical protein